MPAPTAPSQRHVQESEPVELEVEDPPKARRGPRPEVPRQAKRLLQRAGIEINGQEPWDMQVHDARLYRRVMRDGSLGLGEAYMDGWWDAKRLDAFFHRVMAAGLHRQVVLSWPAVWGLVRASLVNLQRGARAFRVGREHYDIGNALYERMLDQRMVYSCGYWRDARDLDEAQEAKLDLICRKLHLEPGMRLLDIGCGWGSLVQYAAEHYDVQAVGITVSREQAALAESRCRGRDVQIRYQDYRDMDDEGFDRVVSVGMFEHVGPKNHARYMRQVHDLLRDGGLHLLHTIGRARSSSYADPWISRYIFPNSVLPSLAQITNAADGRFVVEDVQNLGPHYDPTLMAWCANFEDTWDEIQAESPGLDERFRRMWRYYLLSCAGGFRAGRLQVWQVVMAKDRGVDGGYAPVR